MIKGRISALRGEWPAESSPLRRALRTTVIWDKINARIVSSVARAAGSAGCSDRPSHGLTPPQGEALFSCHGRCWVECPPEVGDSAFGDCLKGQ